MDNTVDAGKNPTPIRVKMLRPDPRHLKLLLTGVDSWNRQRHSEDFKPSLMGAPVYEEFQKADKLEDGYIPLYYVNLRNALLLRADLRKANLEGAQLQDANLAAAKLEGASLQYAQLQRSSLSAALLMEADLRGANLCGTDFQGARLKDAHLAEANLRDADLRDSDFYPTELSGTNLSGTQPWTAKMYPCSDGESKTLEALRSKYRYVAGVGFLSRLVRSLDEHYPADKYAVYFRGDSKLCELRPSVLRLDGERSRKEEGEMLGNLMSRRPEDFSNLTSALDQWVLARHYGLKTRLLDITRNPLVALFHACSDPDRTDANKQYTGRLHVFAVPKELVKPFDSDTISVITNFAKLRVSEQNLLLGRKAADVRCEEEIATTDRYSSAKLRLNQFIRQEKPYFEDRMDPRDLYRVFVVEPRQIFDRIRAQSGAFLISAFHERFERSAILGCNKDIPVYDYYSLEVPTIHKKQILKELRVFNITSETLYPGLAAAAEAVNEDYFPATRKK